MKPLLVAAFALLVAVSAFTFVSESEKMGTAECEELLREYRVGKRRTPKPDTQEYEQIWICTELVKQHQRRG